MPERPQAPSDPAESSARATTRGTSAGACPICGKPRAAALSPFCSRRCADVDLGRWLTDRYVIDGGPMDDDAPER